MAKNDFHKSCQFIVSKILKDKINWAKEIKIAKKLLKEYPEIEFWETLYMDTYPASLSVFLTNTGKNVLSKEYQKFQLVKRPEPIKLAEKPLIKVDVIHSKKSPKTIQQFVDGDL